ncbi:Hypothetical predicted protein [Mytilus galloprovincialis]|uniref:C2H2-type domain-containing protein n=1 Tax=Mytilus galloprovincialis TaxID=29158 RepID=A0A8B6HFC8_MYTGA|nr:Hypothetical predicted protein [Mytilus galloprovincialis]
MRTIYNEFGVVIPIGTCICRVCRRKWLGQKGNEEKCNDVICGPPCTDLEEDDFIENIAQLKWDSNEMDELNVNLKDMEHVESLPTLSQTTSTCITEDSSQNSQISDSSLVQTDKLSNLNIFLQQSGVSPVKHMQGSFLSSERTQRRYLQKANDCLAVVIEAICPKEKEAFMEKFVESHCKSTAVENNQSSRSCGVNVSILKEIYDRAETWTFRRQILSILAFEHTYSQMKQMIPGLTLYRYYAAKKHISEVGCGLPIQEMKQTREKIDPCQLEPFLDFITSSHIIKDLPFGERKLKLSTGEIISTPNVIRAIAPTSIIRQYKQFCEDEEIRPLGTSTMYKILEECAASVRHSVEGLDYYVAEGGRAFRDIEEILEGFDCEDEDIKKMKADLLEVKRYLKSDYKVHVRDMAQIADHCRSYALSDIDSNFRNDCKHEHTLCCTQCLLLESFMDDVLVKVNNKEWDHTDQVMFKVEKAVDDIKEWKGHILRSRNQEEARRHTLGIIEEKKDVMITIDWAMKFLPRKFREGQTDWFAKRGINWHISVSLMKGPSDTYQSITHVHVFSSTVAQDSSVTSSIISDVVQDLIQMNQGLSNVHLFSDNAGCYKSTTTIAALHKTLKGTIKTYNFCEAQDGKGPCDRRASHLKSIIIRYVNEGNDVVTAEQMKKAIDLKKNFNYRVKVVTPVIDLDPVQNSIKSIPGISQLHNFKFEDSCLRVWKAYGIGAGKLIPWTDICQDMNVSQLKTVQNWLEKSCNVFSSDDMTGEEEVEECGPPAKKAKSEENIYSCPIEGCDRSFKNNSGLEQHIIVGNCNYQLEKQSLMDRSKSEYSVKLDKLYPKTVNISCSTTSEIANTVKIGWALKMKKKKTIFNVEQKQFMQDQFDIGKHTGRKVDPFEAAKLMMVEVKNGERRFKKSEYLTGSQISGYFSRLSQKDRKMCKEDITVSQNEDDKYNLKMSVIKKMESL